jgi:hypothetical protein
MKTSELTGAALDWAVAKCENLHPDTDYVSNCDWGVFVNFSNDYVNVRYTPSDDWGWAGSIVEREKISLVYNERPEDVEGWRSFCCVGEPRMEYGSTPLVSAMRCYVASKLGDEIDVPKELTK